MLTDEGIDAAEKLLGVDNLYEPHHMEDLHVVQNALRAHMLYKRDVDYVVKDGKVVIVDEFTGRLMEGRRWSDGLHQAVEAKEGVQVQKENQTYATITFQNYFRMYKKLVGHDRHRRHRSQEFASIYKLDVVVVPTNRPMIRKDHEDVVYRTKNEKWKAVIDEIEECHKRGQPVLVGTIAIETSEMLVGEAQEPRHPPQRAERQAARARGRDRRAGRPQRRDHDLDQHGGPRHRHRARRQPGHDAALARARPRGAREQGRVREGDSGLRGRARGGGRGRRPARARHRAPRVAPHRQPAARPLRPPGRPGLVALLPVARGRPAAHLRLRPHLGPDGAAGHAGGRADRGAHADGRDRERAEQGRGPQLRHPQAPARVRRRHEQAAQEHLPLAHEHSSAARTCAASTRTWRTSWPARSSPCMFPQKGESDLESYVREVQAQFAIAIDPQSPELAGRACPTARSCSRSCSSGSTRSSARRSRCSRTSREVRRLQPADLRSGRARHPAPDARPALEGPPADDGPPEGGRRPAGLRGQEPQAGVPDRGLRAVQRDVRQDRRARGRAAVPRS